MKRPIATEPGAARTKPRPRVDHEPLLSLVTGRQPSRGAPRQGRRRRRHSTTILLTIAYGGGRFAGWSPQTIARTVAGGLLGALRALVPKVRDLPGASRTDGGFHARGQLVAFE